MGKLTVFEVVFDGDNVDVFSSGEVVNGYIRVVLTAPKDDVTAVKLKFKGKAHTHWTEGSEDEEESYSASETYFKEKIVCWGKDDKTRRCLEAGEHRFPFSFKIPDIPLPFPFESSVGWIRYKVKCKIDRPWKFNHHTERLFTVRGQPIDLRAMPNAMHPVHREDTKSVCCLCCETGPIITKASTDKAGYVPGETMYVSGTVENNSSRRILHLTVRLKQWVRYFSSGGHSTRREYNVINERAPGCEEGEVARMDWKPHVIPSIPPTGPQGCRIMRIEYVVHFEGDVENTPFDANVYLPITIGTVPVYRPPYQDPSGVIVQQPTSSGPPPPSYEIALDGLQEIPSKSGYDYTFGKLMYAPQYPTYNLPAQPPAWDPMHPPPVQDPTYPPGGYPPPSDPTYPPAFGAGYPPPGVPEGYPPPSAAQVYPPPAGGTGYPPPEGNAGCPPPAGAQGYPPPAGAQGYPPPVNGEGYPPPAGAGDEGHPPPVGSEDHTPAAGDGGEGSTDEKPPAEGTEAIELEKIEIS